MLNCEVNWPDKEKFGWSYQAVMKSKLINRAEQIAFINLTSTKTITGSQLQFTFSVSFNATNLFRVMESSQSVSFFNLKKHKGRSYLIGVSSVKLLLIGFSVTGVGQHMYFNTSICYVCVLPLWLSVEKLNFSWVWREILCLFAFSLKCIFSSSCFRPAGQPERLS